MIYREIDSDGRTIERVIEVPSDWGMFSYQGNKSLQEKAEKLLSDVSESRDDSAAIERAFKRYLGGYRRMCLSKTMSEAADTMVSDLVYDFAKLVAKALDLNYDFVDRAWAKYSF